jgi:hypothetical protein
MTEIAYSISMLDGITVTGVASKLFVADESTLFTISANHAPWLARFQTEKLSSSLSKGSLKNLRLQMPF